MSQQTTGASIELMFPKKISLELSKAPGWKFRLTKNEMPFPGNGSYRGYLMGLRQGFPDIIKPKLLDTAAADTTIIGLSFQGNGFGGGTPSDNAMGISDDGFILSSINSDLSAWKLNNEDSVPELILNVSLANFCDTLGLTAHKYDPKIIFDPEEQKFIFVFLIGSRDNTNYIVCAFSSSSDPNDPWHIYALPGNPLNNHCWSDYPALAVSQSDLFITSNQIITDSSWQSGFNGSTIWQIDKSSAFSGDSLKTQLWHDIRYDGDFVRNLHPVKGGDGHYGDKMHFLSNRNFDLKNDTIFFLTLDGAIMSDTLNLEINALKMDTPYGVPPVARQVIEHTFETNDSRVLGAFKINDHIQFVGNSMNFTTNSASFYHGKINDIYNTPYINANIITDTLDLAYPNLSYSGKYDGDKEAIISFLHSGPYTYSGTSCMFYDRFKGYSQRQTIKEGSYLVNVIGGSYERWGDYTGSQRKYNEPGVVWFTGTYGQKKESGLIDTYFNSTWITKATSPDSSMQDPIVKPDSNSFFSYPNPASKWFSTTFTLENEKNINVSIYDMNGRLVKVLLEDLVSSGEHNLSFVPTKLSNGIYFLRVIERNQILYTYKFIKQ
jgi:hypothetical protein